MGYDAPNLVLIFRKVYPDLYAPDANLNFIASISWFEMWWNWIWWQKFTCIITKNTILRRNFQGFIAIWIDFKLFPIQSISSLLDSWIQRNSVAIDFLCMINILFEVKTLFLFKIKMICRIRRNFPENIGKSKFTKNLQVFSFCWVNGMSFLRVHLSPFDWVFSPLYCILWNNLVNFISIYGNKSRTKDSITKYRQH